ncbi:MAG: sugar transferase [Candidatus Pacebacteria bacterium]|nr:sugar transferase [Candidatus Paceibacterota bacterium]
MATVFRPRTLILFVGDLVFFVFALWLSLLVRNAEVPTWSLFELHLEPFAYLFAAWVVVYFIAGLYEGRSIILARRALSSTLLYAQIVNMFLAALFFFVVPFFGIAPKTILFVYLVISFPLILIWRAVLFPRLGFSKPEKALVVGGRAEVLELAQVLANSPFAPVRIAATIHPNGVSIAHEVEQALLIHNARYIIADFNDPKVASAFPQMYNLLSMGVRFFDALALYEQVLGRIPLSILDDRWFARNISRYAHMLYDGAKRFIDIVVGVLLSVVPLVCYPFFALIIKLQDGGPVFYTQVRMGQNNQPFVMLKFRSMSGTDQGSEVLKSKHVVTPFGKFLRVSRLDEFPQAWNVLRGDMSLVGPRPEFPALVEEYEKEIPYYGVRHLVKPGLSGWAQLYHDNHPHHGTEVEATREKLSYDLYYLKHRSITLDAIIILKTIKKLLTRSGV